MAYFPSGVLTYTPFSDLSPAEATSAARWQTLKTKANKTAEELSEFNNLTSALSTKIFSSATFNSLFDEIIALETFFLASKPTWNDSTTYAVGDCVTSGGYIWQALTSNTNSQPSDLNVNWNKMTTDTPGSLPAGGAVGQFLMKRSTTDYDAEWGDVQAQVTVTGILKGDGEGGISQAVAGTDYAAANHDHDAAYAAKSHNHDGTYATASHNHDSVYSKTTHNHSGTYAAYSHSHSGYASSSHNHDGTYAPVNLYGQNDIVAGSTSLGTGQLYLVYE